ncbi:MAG: squalene/phytoene synthase family protein [Magnetovibrio sp.]|nr:squalene/phytoene synthase family protein [Magnetovibrio sp.]
MSTKGHEDENFPVASFLLPKWSRPHVLTFYDFVRGADDIADAFELSPDQKREQLTALSVSLEAGEGALAASLVETGVRSIHAQDLLKAFLWDVDHPRTDDWAALMAYCQLSAAPVGRYLIDLLGGIDGEYAPSDALCAALQVLNHIQDIKDDFNQLDRVYVPCDWMHAEGVALDELTAPQSSQNLRRVLDRMLDGVDALLIEAQPMTKTIKSRSLAREAGGILAIARGLSHELRQRDPLTERVELSKYQMLPRFVWGALWS